MKRLVVFAVLAVGGVACDTCGADPSGADVVVEVPAGFDTSSITIMVGNVPEALIVDGNMVIAENAVTSDGETVTVTIGSATNSCTAVGVETLGVVEFTVTGSLGMNLNIEQGCGCSGFSGACP